MRLPTAILCATLCCAQSTPKIGEMLDAAGSVRPVFGLAGSFFAGEPEVERALSFTCGTQLCLAKTDSQIVSATGSVDAPPGPALFGIDGDSATVYFPEAGTFARWRKDSLEPMDLSIEGEVLAVGKNRFVVRREETVWIVGPDGSVLDAVTAKDGPVMLLADGLVYIEGDELVLRDKRFTLPHVASFAAMSAHYVQVNADGVAYALRIDAGREALYVLPGVSE